MRRLLYVASLIAALLSAKPNLGYSQVTAVTETKTLTKTRTVTKSLTPTRTRTYTSGKNVTHPHFFEFYKNSL